VTIETPDREASGDAAKRPSAPAALRPLGQELPAVAASASAATPASATSVSSAATATSTPTAPPADSAASSAATPDIESKVVSDLIVQAAVKEQGGQLLEARKLYAEALAKDPSAAQRAAILPKITDLCARTLLASAVMPEDEAESEYVVQSGDRLATIAPRFMIPYEQIKRLNRLTSDSLQPGQKLKVVKGPFNVRVSKGTHTLELWLRDTPVKVFQVAIGTQDKTPSGTYPVTNKVINPRFDPPKSARGILSSKASGAPDNPLGSRWIAFGSPADSLGIHGTNDPTSIGKSVSLGCVRMQNADVELLYDFLVVGMTKVEIVE
jgi:lipoprotein-anchoring transpeptidase ErfK/SrfK